MGSSGLSECNEICYKDPVLKDQQWSAYIDRSPGAANYSEVFNLSAILYHICIHVMILDFSIYFQFFISNMVELLFTQSHWIVMSRFLCLIFMS